MRFFPLKENQPYQLIMSVIRRSARIAANAAAKPAVIYNIVPKVPSKKAQTEALLRDVEETSYWLHTEWDEELVYNYKYITEYIEGSRVRLARMANHIEETMKAVRREMPKNPEHWTKVLGNLEYGTRFVIGAMMCYMPATKEGYYIKNDADWILRVIRDNGDVWY